MNTDYIAKRTLLFSEKGSDVKSQFVVKISFPYEVTEEDVNFRVDGTLTRCDIAVEGVETNYALDKYGVDSVQAVNIASNIDPLIEHLSKKYDIFWNNGEPYFDFD